MIGRHLAVRLVGDLDAGDTGRQRGLPCAGAYSRQMFGNPPAIGDILGLPVPIFVLGFAIVLSVVGVAWLRRVTGDPEDGDEHWRFRR
jgi:hypothetical protein